MTIFYLNFSFSYRETRWKVNSYVKLKDDYLNIGINICILGYIKLKKSLWLNRNFRAQGISVSSLRFVVSEVLFHVQGFFKMRTFFSLAIRISAFATDDISITRYNCRLTWTNLKILPKFGDQHSIYLGFLRWLNWSVLKNLWKISFVIFSKPLRCVQRKPSTVEVLNFTKRPGEKVLTIYHRKSLFKDKSSNISSTSSKSSSFE